MKYLFIVISIFAFSLSILAQERVKDNIINKHEISFSVDDIFSTREIDFDPYETGPYDNDLFKFHTYYLKLTRMGLSYKYHFEKSAIRSKFTFRQNKNVNNIINLEKEENSDYRFYEVFLGYEFSKTLNKTLVFYGADLFYNYYNINSEYKTLVVGSEAKESYKYKVAGFGISPLIGVKYFISPMISISSEMKFIIERYNGDYVVHYERNSPDINYKYVFDGNRFKIGPLGNISINIHL